MKKGFTLVELSIVLVIIGLLIGGILVAQSMISASKIHRVVFNLQQYEIALDNFYTNYKQFPGDSNLFRYPGNNNGHGLDNGSACSGELESSNSFAHLSQSGMIKGNYVPLCDAPDNSEYASAANAGIVSPAVSDTPIAYDGAYSGSKGFVLIAKFPSAKAVSINFTIAASEVIPLEQKFTNVTSDANGRNFGGLFNTAGKGNCLDGNYDEFPCTQNPNNTFGELYYYSLIK